MSPVMTRSFPSIPAKASTASAAAPAGPPTATRSSSRPRTCPCRRGVLATMRRMDLTSLSTTLSAVVARIGTGNEAARPLPENSTGPGAPAPARRGRAAAREALAWRTTALSTGRRPAGRSYTTMAGVVPAP